MKATLSEMLRNPKKILDAIARNERVILLNRGKRVARIEPIQQAERCSASKHPAFGIWADRDDLKDPSAYMRDMRKRRW